MDSISDSERTIWVLERCTIVASTPASYSAEQMSCAELFEPITITCLPLYRSGPGWRDEWCCSPLKVSMPLNCGMFGLADMPVANTTTLHSFLASSQFARLAVVPVQ